jgi:predicted enzyme related to lactoylglutathione lyase
MRGVENEFVESVKRFVWHELLSNDVDSAARFYAEVIKGNTHMLMQDDNSLDIAEILLNWIGKHVTTVP